VFGINGGEFLVLLAVAVIVIGPERLPKYAEQLAGLVKRARVFIDDARAKVDSELKGDDAVDWTKLDPRQYDPRRIVREALLDDDMKSTFTSLMSPLSETAAAATAALPTAAEINGSSATPAYVTAARPRDPAASVPFDDEAT
jgi:sec-independent protein translocase protein TatB